MDLRDLEKRIGLEYLVSVTTESTCKSIFIGSKVIAILGYYHMWGGVINVFVIPSKHVKRYAKSFLRLVRQELEQLWVCPFLKLHRMETKSLADADTERWMKWLGFHCEGTMVGYSQDRRDYCMWARVNLDGTIKRLDIES